MTSTPLAPSAAAAPRGPGLRVDPLAHPSPPLVALAEAGAECGGKASGLAALLSLGLSVPAGVALPNEVFQEHLARAGLPSQASTGGLAAALDPRDQDEARRRSRAFTSALRATPLASSLRSALRALGAGPWILRSSALGEDGRHASFAGILQTCAGQGAGDGLSNAELPDALLEVWASFASPAALLYQAARGVQLQGCGVVIQSYVPALAAGVLFTSSPDPRHSETPLLEYVWGPGEELVSGRAAPGRYLLERGAPPRLLRRAPGEGAEEEGAEEEGAEEEGAEEEGAEKDDAEKDDADKDDADKEAVLRAALGELALAGWLIQDAQGAPQDLEWVLDTKGALHLVQTRPITTLGLQPAPAVLPKGPRHDSPAPHLRWSNSNVNENYPDPLTPFLYSIAREGYTHYFRNLGRAFGVPPERLRAAEPALETIVGAHGGHLYYNLTSIHEVLRLLPGGQSLAAAFNRFTGARGVSAARAGAPGWGRGGRLREGISALRALRAATWSMLTVPRGLVRFERAADEFAERTRPGQLTERSALELRQDLQAFLAIRFQGWTPAGLCDSAALLSYAATRALLGWAFAEGEESTRVNDLLSGLRDVVSGQSVDALWDLGRAVRADPRLQEHFRDEDALERVRADPACAEFQAQLEAWLEAWGFRHAGELLLTRPSFQEDPRPLVPLIRAYAALDEEGPREVQARQERERQAVTKRAFASLRGVSGRVVAWGLRALLRWARAAIGWRERARLKQALLYTRLRQVVLALGKRLCAKGILASPEDALFLTYRELDELALGGALLPGSLRELVAIRQASLAELALTAPPDAFELPEGAYRADPLARPFADAPLGKGPLRGTPAAAGVVCGRAIVLDDVSQAGLLQPGDVLVVRQTDPGWAPVFFLLGGLILERGGMLSHGAILAREYGIPTVVEVSEATRRIPNGTRVRLDGSRGTIEVLPPGAAGEAPPRAAPSPSLAVSPSPPASREDSASPLSTNASPACGHLAGSASLCGASSTSSSSASGASGLHPSAGAAS